MGGSGVQRPLKFVKYLREFGWNPIVLCPEPGAYHTFDESLQKELQEMEIEVHRVEADTPFHKGGQRKKHVSVPDFIARVLRWISGFIYLPDNKKKWIEPGFRKALQITEDNKVEMIFSSAPPYSNLMLAKMMKETTGIPAVMDLRDDWVASHLLSYPTLWHRRKMEKLEVETLSKADQLLTVNRRIAKSIYSRTSKEVQVIEHGYDPEDFEKAVDVAPSSPGKVSFLYSGLFYKDSTPVAFLKAISEIIRNKPELKDRIELQFQGGLSTSHWKAINKLKLTSMVVDYGYADHALAVKNLMKADVLWLNIGQKRNPEIISLGKTTEYFATKKPILGLIPEGSAKDLLLEYGRAYIAAPYDIDQIKDRIYRILNDLDSGTVPDYSASFVESFNRRSLTGKLAQIFDKISSQ